jgi:hypothetical protein
MARIQITDINASDLGIVEPVKPTTREELPAQFDELSSAQLDELSDEDLQYVVGGCCCCCCRPRNTASLE